MDDFCHKVEVAAEAIYQEFEQMPVPAENIRAGELRVLRSIRFAVIRDMASRLTRA